MEVALVLGRDEPRRDGVADYVHRLAAALPAQGVEAVVVEAGGRVRAAARELEALAPDVVHVQFAPSAYGYRPGVGLLPHLVRAPVVTTLHEYGWWSWPPRVPDAAWRAVERTGLWDRETLRLVPASRAVVVTNGAHAQTVRARTGRTPRLVPIGPNVDRVPADRAEVRRRHGLPDRAPVVVFFGFVHPVKGVRWLLGAVAALRASTHPDLHLVVAGGFDSLALPGQEARDFEAEVRGQVAALGLDDVVRITGWVEAAEVSALLQAADVAALPFTARPDHQERLAAGRARPRPAARRHPRRGHVARAGGRRLARAGARERGAGRQPAAAPWPRDRAPPPARSPTPTPGTPPPKAHAEVYAGCLTCCSSSCSAASATCCWPCPRCTRSPGPATACTC